MSVLSYIVFVLVSVAAFLLGGVGAYFYYRARHHEAATGLEALKQDLSERENELHRLQNEITDAYQGGFSGAPLDEKAELSRLRDELEQKKNDYNILKQDFDVEIGILRQEVEQFKGRKADLEQARLTQERRDADPVTPGVSVTPGVPDDAVRARESKLSSHEQELAARTQELAGRERELAAVTQELAVRERALANLKIELAKREQTLAERERQLAAREGQVDEEIASRRREVEQSLADREQRIQAGLASMDRDQEVLARAREELSERESRLDDEFLGLPEDKFTSRQEAVLIKRLKHQNKLQRNELEQVRLLYHRIQRSTASPTDTSEAFSQSKIADDHGDSSSSITPPALSAKSVRSDRHHAEGSGEPAAKPAVPANSEHESDNLTALLGIDLHVQNKLNQMGITSFDQIAHWSSEDVRRIAEHLQIDPKTIQDHWLISAQSHLFADVRGNRAQAE
jgi:predicted flap endonuclease-1-like 5' DNA nuclease